jgi:YjjG family noncanonical pyrimidine nucleotidase
MKTYDVFLLDADGTLFDYDKAEENALKNVFNKYWFSYTEDVRTIYKKINKALWDSLEKGQIDKRTIQVLRFKQLFDALSIKGDPKKFGDDYLIELGKGSYLIEGALELCKSICQNGKKAYIVTNGISSTQKARLENSLIKPYITNIFISEEIGYHKPNPLYFEYVFSHIPNVEKSNLIIIGDSISADIAGGILAGIDSCWFNKLDSKNNTDIAPTYEIRSLTEVFALIV